MSTWLRQARNAAKAAGLCLALALPAGAAGPFSLFASTAPGDNQVSADTNSVELGMRLRPSQNGHITGIRYYKFPANNGPHSGRLWTNGGALLGAVNFAVNASTGWQTAIFATPIAVTSGTTYVASYHTNSGYAATRFYFTAPRDVPPLHAPASAPGSLNGVYLYGTTPGFPTQSTRQSNYWVDVLFTTPEPAGPLSLATLTPSSGTSGTLPVAATGTGFEPGMSLRLERRNAALGAWSAAGSMSFPRVVHTLTVLRDGRVLAVGGHDSGVAISSSADIYNPATNAWTPTGPLAQARYDHIAVRLADGRVLVAGGRVAGGDTRLASAELYDPATGVWTPTGSMAQARGSFTAALLPDGKVLAVAGFDGVFLNSCELYDPETGTWSPAASLTHARGTHAMTRLADGRLLVAGGGGAPGVNVGPSELFDPATGTWSVTGTLALPRFGFGMMLLGDGRVLAVGGGTNGGVTATAELYDPATGSWIPAASRANASFVNDLVPFGGWALTAGGSSDPGALSVVEAYDPVGGAWRTLPSLSVPRAFGRATGLLDGSVLATGGDTNGPANFSAERFTAPASSIPATGVVVQSSTSLTGDLFLTGAATGYWDAVATRGSEVARKDAAFRVLAPSTVCVTSSGGVWQNRSFATQTGQFDAVFEAIPGQNGMDGQVGLSDLTVDAFTDLATIVRFNSSGFIDARNGGAYAASLAVPYTAGTTYRFRLRVNVETRQYTVFVSTPGGGERVLASEFDFRTEQAGVTQLDNLGVRGDPGTMTACHFAVAPVGPASSIRDLSPSSAQAGGPGFQLTVFGDGFTPSSLVRWNASARPTTFISSEQLRADISAADIATPGTAVVTVQTPGGGESGARTFIIRGAPTAQWSLTGSAPGADTATLLEDGRVLATDGTAEGDSAPSAFYTRASGSWTLTGATGPGFRREALQLREDFGGRVLITGGALTECCQETAELFDPAVGSATATGSMNFQRADHTLTPLRFGQILATGGMVGDTDGESWATAEEYEPRTGVWTNTVSMTVARQGHTATRLFDDRVLVAGGYVRDVNAVPPVDHVTATVERYSKGFAPVSVSTWATVASMSVPRMDHQAVRLADGRVLVLGGSSSPGGPALASAEIFDPGSGSWTPVASMSSSRVHHAATLLENGHVLVTGGQAVQGFGEAYNSAELYDPATDTWSPAGFMNRSYSNHNALLLATGEVLVVGKGGLAELFHSDAIPALTGLVPNARAAGGPAFTLTVRGARFAPGSIVRWNGADRTTSFVSASTLTAQIPAGDISSVRSASVTVFNPGPGGGGSNVETFLVYDGSAAWIPAARMSRRRFGATATRLLSGKVLVAGGSDEFAQLGDVYDPASGSWSVTVDSTPHMGEHIAALLGDGRVLLAGGGAPGNGECCLNEADLYDPATNGFIPTGSMARPRGEFTATVLLDGRVLIAGGYESNEFPAGEATAELYNSTAGVWTNTGSMGTARAEHAATLLADGRVLASGGNTETQDFTATAELYNPATGAWSPTGSMSIARRGHTSTRLQNGRVLVAGGQLSSFGQTASAELFDPATGAWTPTGSMTRARGGHTATLLPDGRVLVAGGGDSELYDPGSGSWSPAGSMVAARGGHGAVLLLDGRVLAAGGASGDDSAHDARSAELFRPPEASTGPRSAVVVSLTFDDGSAGQALAGQILADRGLKGTFYVNSAQLGTSGFYMTLADVQGLAAAGHEIGGHTLNHVDLTTVTATEARRQVCDDRAQLAAWDFAPASFAYPFGRFNDSVKDIVRDCGYASGRGVDAGFSIAESSPPADAYAIRTPDAITSSQTLTDLQRLVLDAEQGGGGWVPLVFHQICQGCSPLSTSSATLAAFLDWLAARGPLTTVRTVREVAGDAPAGAFVDTFPQPDGLITNENAASPRSPKWLVTDGSLFADGGQGWTGVPDDVTPNAASSNGTGSAVFRAQTVPSDLGSDVSLRLTVSNFVSVIAPQAYDGVHVWLRFLNAQNYYHISLRRRDNRAAIKKRRNGVISTFTTPLYGAPALGTPQDFRAVATTNPNGSVSIQIFHDGALIASAVDTANPIVGAGKVVVAGENVNFRFDDFTVAPLPGSGASVAAAADGAQMSFAPASLLVKDEYGARVERIDGTGAHVPEGALGRDVEVSVGRADEADDAEAKSRRRREKGIAGATDEIEFGPSTLSFAQPVTVALGYDPRRLEKAGLKEEELKVYAWNKTLGDWTALPSTVDREARTVSAMTDHFSVYQAMAPGDGIGVAAADPSFGWKALYAFPNPVRGTSRVGVVAQPGIVDSVEIAVYDLSGRKVHSSSDFRFGGAVDDGNGLGAQFTYAHVWDVSGVPSGVYTYVVTARKAGEGEKRKSGKLAVIK